VLPKGCQADSYRIMKNGIVFEGLSVLVENFQGIRVFSFINQ
jgi:hypothetical protein